MSSAKKRPRPEEENQAECPFAIVHPNPNEKSKKPKRRRGDSEDGPKDQEKIMLQVSPFSPTGRFRDPANNMDRHYSVKPTKDWFDMTRYNSFVLNGVKYYSEGFIFVANSSTIERQRNPGEAMQPRQKSDDDWVARILEIRASDEHHVYARVYWMYWPDELPFGTLDGKRTVAGRQSYHGNNELIASNHMDIINVVSVTASAVVNQWIEQNEEEVQPALYWRQAYDVRTGELSSVELRCKCNRPENPDKTLIGCTNPTCKKWLHDDCLVHEALLQTYKRLGTDKPHTPVAPVKEELENNDDEPKRPLSPTESNANVSAQQSIDVKPEEQKTIKLADVEGTLPAIEAEDPSTSVQVANNENGSLEPKKRGRPRKSEVSDKPYLGLFEAVIRNETSPPTVEITDLRDISGGEKTWTESINCLICSQTIH